jgi:hypothetical protein
MYASSVPMSKIKILWHMKSVDCLQADWIILCIYHSYWIKALSTGWRREMGKFEVDYEIPPRCQIPSAHAIRTWVRKFQETGSALKRKA